MDYYELLGLSKEPFAMTPDPNFFYQSKIHGECLNRLEISLRLNRGLNVVIGGVGSGKTTLSRLLLGRFVHFGKDFRFHLILDPSWKDDYEFLYYLMKLFGLENFSGLQTDMMDEIEHYLLDMAVTQKKKIVIIIDEGQKMNSSQIEILRTLLNFETNDAKLIQIIIFAQSEFKMLLDKHENFKDRIAFAYTLNPLTLDETGKFIRHRLKIAGLPSDAEIFTENAVNMIHEKTNGYPRKIVTACHNLLLDMLVEEKNIVRGEDVFKRMKDSDPFNV